MCEMESGLNERLDLVTFQVQKTPHKSEEMSGIIASTRISDRWATSDQSLEKVLPHVEKVEAADSGKQRKTETESRPCNCAKILCRQTKSLWISSWSVSWSDSATSHHLRTCQNWYPSQEVCTTKLSVFQVNSLAAIALSASIEISKTAGRFCKISPSLTFRGWVNGSSPAFTLLKDLRKSYWDNDPAKRSKKNKQISLLDRSVRRLLKEGDVSPYEVDENGRTLLHNALLCTATSFCVPAFRELVHTLLNAGVAINEVDLAGKTAFDYFISSLNGYGPHNGERNLVGELLANKGAEMSDILLKAGAGDFEMSVEMHCVYMLEPWQDATECGPLSLAVLRESEQDVIRILRAKPSSIYELNRRKLNPLHLACCWPRGIQLLLDAGAQHLVHQVDVCGGLPIRYSTKFHCLGAIELLINAGSAFSSPGWFGGSEEVLGIVWNDPIPLFLLRTFQERRRKLFELAKLTLPAEVWADLDVPTDRLLDDRAAEIQRVLIDAGIEIPKSISVPQRRRTVYHADIRSAKQADQLWDAGFRDIDSCDESGRTPLSESEWYRLEYAQWLLHHGADSGREICDIHKDHCGERKPVAGFTALHSMANRFGLGFANLLVNKSYPALLLDFGELLVNGDSHDDCHCACSSSGCTPFTILLKTIDEESCRDFAKDLSEPADVRRLLVREIESPGHPASSAPMRSKIVEKLIRFETFEALQLTHTCCDFDFYEVHRQYTPEEVQDIHEEWEELLSQHEDLVSEFCHKFQELGGTLVAFFEGYWQTRMDNVLKEEKPYDEEDIRKMRETGVVLEEVSDETEKDVTDQDLTDGDLTDEDQIEGPNTEEEEHEHNQGV